MILIPKPKLIVQGQTLVHRGGGWVGGRSFCMAVRRYRFIPIQHTSTLSFRILMRIKP